MKFSTDYIEATLGGKVCHIGTTKESGMVLVMEVNEHFIAGVVLSYVSDNGDKQTYKNTDKVVLYGINQITRLLIEGNIEVQ